MSEFIPKTKGEWPAFPSMHYDLAEHEHGLTMRDYFAAKALQGLLMHTPWQYVYKPEEMAKNAYSLADAMMEEKE